MQAAALLVAARSRPPPPAAAHNTAPPPPAAVRTAPMQQDELSAPEQEAFLQALARALGLGEEAARDGFLFAESEAGLRVEGRFFQGQLLLAFTDYAGLPKRGELAAALAAAYCAAPARHFVPSLEPMSRRLRFQRNLPEGGLPPPESLAAELLEAMARWAGRDGGAGGPSGGAGGPGTRAAPAGPGAFA